jgi:hypothetical protein
VSGRFELLDLAGELPVWESPRVPGTFVAVAHRDDSISDFQEKRLEPRDPFDRIKDWPATVVCTAVLGTQRELDCYSIRRSRVRMLSPEIQESTGMV